MLLAVPRFSREFDSAALSDRPQALRTLPARSPLPRFNRLFRQTAAAPLLGPVSPCMAGSGIFTACASPAPFGFGLAPGLP